jgi:hypothetical protein
LQQAQQAGEAKNRRLRILMQEGMCKKVCAVKERDDEMGGRRNCINSCDSFTFSQMTDCLANTTSATARTSGNDRS